jgi:hypothetical protein
MLGRLNNVSLASLSPLEMNHWLKLRELASKEQMRHPASKMRMLKRMLKSWERVL